MELHLRSILKAEASVADLCGGRINWGEHPQGQPRPSVVLTVISDADDYTLDGATGILEARVQVDCYAGTYAAAQGLVRAVRAFLSGYRDANFQGVFMEGSTRRGRDGGTAEAERLFRHSIDFMIHYNQA